MRIKKIYNDHYDDSFVLALASELDIDKKVIEILLSRGFDTKEKILNFINPQKEYLLNNPFLLDGMNDCVVKIKNAIKKRKRILIFGDYDVDGISATFVMIRAIQALHYNCNFFLPNRFVDGYGLTKETIDKVKQKYEPDLMITVDCGISCADEVKYAKQCGIDVIVTDHHEIPNSLPDCITIDPKKSNQSYPYQFLCGAGVAFKVAQALLGTKNLTEEMLAVVAIATISDIVPLTDENRAITYYGLKCLNSLPVGIKMMFKEQKISLEQATSSDISFKIAPKLNSSGRMGEAADSLFLYLEDNKAKLSRQLERINKHNLERQSICLSVYNDCIEMLENIDLSNEKCIILKKQNWDSGILGIVCARLVENYHRPVFLFSEENGILKGSGRSIENINIHEMLTCSSDYLLKFGGHSMAAGLSLDADKFPDFVLCVKKYINEKVNDSIFYDVLLYDIDLDGVTIDEKFYHDLSVFEPTGNQNVKPLFKVKTSSDSITLMKNHREHAIIKHNNLNLLYFNCQNVVGTMKYSNSFDIVFEFQNTSYKNGEFDCIVKGSDIALELASNVDEISSMSFAFELENILNVGCTFYKEFKQIELASLIYESKKTMFGNLFVCFKQNTYNRFIKNYDISSIYDHFVGEVSNNNSINAIVFAPTSFKNFSAFKNVVFLDRFFSEGFISVINSIKPFNIFVSVNKREDLYSLKCDRNTFAYIYSHIVKFDKTPFSNYLSFYKKLKPNCNYEQFIFCLKVFEELKIVDITNIISINNGIKRDLKDSLVYNYVNNMRGSSEGKN